MNHHLHQFHFDCLGRGSLQASLGFVEPEEKFLSIVMFAITILLWPLGTVAFFVKIVQTKKIQPSMIVACVTIFLMLSVFFYFAQK